ncbi:unnamed protein product [Rotaria socialis]|uniref:G-protein coupled receptors family 1 profile domain-containing protein n=1 Tax=Rotaria socialis TaxID=392032 RepID=A0A817QSS9_9BILA|nr:unnamed protein product [Rotaria socialis]CAF3223754.1 unnamed protein product [Rotaria socialis]CAF4208601.1 unnamed protein product [Rotaria socialis]CAF4335164.1 unnamed protein product [Rotaria socialis]
MQTPRILSNSSNNTSLNRESEQDMFVTYYPLALVISGSLFNLVTFGILWRPAFRDTHKRPTIHYMRTIAIFDILMLYGWNFDHFLYGAYGFTLSGYSVPFCKIFSFWNYFTCQVSAWLRVFICLDRYLSLSYLHKTWFSQSKNVLTIIACIVSVFTIINFHLFIFACYNNPDGTLNKGSYVYRVYPLWDYLNLALYNCVPFIFMFIFNSGVIYHLFRIHQNSLVQNSRIQHRSISITLVITTFLFVIMTVPATIFYAFFFQTSSYFILHFFDSILYTYHVLSFFLYFITFPEFRREALKLAICNKWRNTQSLSTVTKFSTAPAQLDEI